MTFAEIGEGLRAARVGRGWTQRQVAERCGLSSAQVSKAERGLIVNEQDYARIAVVLELTLDKRLTLLRKNEDLRQVTLTHQLEKLVSLFEELDGQGKSNLVDLVGPFSRLPPQLQQGLIRQARTSEVVEDDYDEMRSPMWLAHVLTHQEQYRGMRHLLWVLEVEGVLTHEESILAVWRAKEAYVAELEDIGVDWTDFGVRIVKIRYQLGEAQDPFEAFCGEGDGWKEQESWWPEWAKESWVGRTTTEVIASILAHSLEHRSEVWAEGRGSRSPMGRLRQWWQRRNWEMEKVQEGEEQVDGMIYFVLDPPSGHIKIGHSDDFKRRLKELRTEHGNRIEVLGVIPDSSRDRETSLHQRFFGHRIHGEWFYDHEDLRRYIERCAVDWPIDISSWRLLL